MIPLLALFGFVSGSVLYSELLPRLFRGIDIREKAEDHNPGATNAFKYGGFKLGLFSLICDLAKGFLPIQFALHFIEPNTPGFSLVLCAPVLGHAFSPFAHFKGGKAIAASFGVLLALLPLDPLVLHLAFWFILFSTLLRIQPHAARTICSFALTAMKAAISSVPPVALGTTLILLTTTYRHRSSLHSERFRLLCLKKQLWPLESEHLSIFTH